MRPIVAIDLTEDRVSVIARSAETISLGLLRAIDGTVEALQRDVSMLQGVTTTNEEVTKTIKGVAVEQGQYLDPDDVAIEALERCASGLKDHLTYLVRKRSAIDKDGRLTGDHCEALHDAYEQAMNATAEVIESVEVFRSAIISHDLAAEPRASAETFATIQELIESCK